MRHTYIPDANECKVYYLRSQNGGGLRGFHGARIQRGYGLGSFFKSIARVAIPLVKKGVNAIGQDVLEGKSIKQAVASRGRQAVNDLAKQGVDNIKRQIGGGSKRKSTNQSGPSKRLNTNSRKKVVTSTRASKRTTSPLDTQENIFDSPPTKKWRKQ